MAAFIIGRRQSYFYTARGGRGALGKKIQFYGDIGRVGHRLDDSRFHRVSVSL